MSEVIVATQGMQIRQIRGGLLTAVPGLLLTGGIAGLAFALRGIPGVAILSPMILATLIGMAVHNFAGTLA